MIGLVAGSKNPNGRPYGQTFKKRRPYGHWPDGRMAVMLAGWPDGRNAGRMAGWPYGRIAGRMAVWP
jgi:hypothetical protein